MRSTKNTRSAGLEMLKGRQIKHRHNTGQTCTDLSPFQGEPFVWMVPRVETLGFYEADFVKTRRENCFLFIFVSFLDDL